jgi:hypothetical protein
MRVLFQYDFFYTTPFSKLLVTIGDYVQTRRRLWSVVE